MYNNLIAYYERLFAFKQYHNWTMDEVYEMMPWEIDVMVSFINNYLETQEMNRKQAIANANK